MERKALGKGIEAFFVDDPLEASEATSAKKSEKYQLLPLAKVFANPNQPRKQFDPTELQSLAESIKMKGVIQPILVTLKGSLYQIIAGERRFRAAKLAGLDAIPALVENFSDEEVLEIALLENLQRQDLNPIEEAAALQRLIQERSYSQEDLAKRLGKSRPYVSNALRLLQLPEKLQSYVSDKKLSAGHARAILGADNALVQTELADKAIAEQVSVREVERWMQDLKNLPAEKEQAKPKASSWNEKEDIERALSRLVSSEVKIDSQGKNKGWLKIKFHNQEDFNRIFKLLSQKR